MRLPLFRHSETVQIYQKNPKGSPFFIFRHYATYRKLLKSFEKKIGFFSSIFSFLKAFVVSSCRKSGFRVLLSLRYGTDLGRSRLVACTGGAGPSATKVITRLAAKFNRKGFRRYADAISYIRTTISSSST